MKYYGLARDRKKDNHLPREPKRRTSFPCFLPAFLPSCLLAFLSSCMFFTSVHPAFLPSSGFVVCNNELLDPSNILLKPLCTYTAHGHHSFPQTCWARCPQSSACRVPVAAVSWDPVRQDGHTALASQHWSLDLLNPARGIAQHQTHRRHRDNLHRWS